MRLTSNDLMACPDSCISDAGANCLICERLAETKFINMLMNDKFYLVLKEAEEIKYAEDYILEKKSELEELIDYQKDFDDEEKYWAEEYILEKKLEVVNQIQPRFKSVEYWSKNSSLIQYTKINDKGEL